jgi:hypothetical protein
MVDCRLFNGVTSVEIITIAIYFLDSKSAAELSANKHLIEERLIGKKRLG